jgi:hypothetical protein
LRATNRVYGWSTVSDIVRQPNGRLKIADLAFSGGVELRPTKSGPRLRKQMQ